MFTYKQACQYSIVPHDLGFCGPKQNCSNIFLEYINKNKNKKLVKTNLKKFPAVYYYCKQIARANGIKDPLREDVLEAYWIGNDLLKKAQYKNGGYPHHSYHVWKDKPFNPDIELTDKLKKICQVSARKVGDYYYSYHWKKRIHKLNKVQLKNLKYYNKINKCLKLNPESQN